MSVTDKLTGIRAKIERTKKHITDLEDAVRSFLQSGPYRVGVKHDPNTRKLIYYVAHVEDVPTDITQIAGDAFGSMVSILDHLAFRLYLKSIPEGLGRHIYFPIARSAKTTAEYEAACKGKVQGIEPKTVIPDLLSIEAYQGGKGHQLWVLNELNNLSKHRDLIAVGSRFRSIDLGAHAMAHLEKIIGQAHPKVSAFFTASPVLCPLNVGDDLFIDAPDAEPNPKMQFAFDVAINEPQIIQAEPLIEMVHQLAGAVEAIVNQFAKYL
jgi:hypothetical protein